MFAFAPCYREVEATTDVSFNLVSAVNHVQVLPEMVGAVLGSRGAMVKSIREKTGADIHVEGTSTDALISVRGGPFFCP